MDRRTFLFTLTAGSEAALKARESVPRPEHPRPDLYRSSWHNLNGVWDFAFDSRPSSQNHTWADAPEFDRRILVPFCPESELSGIHDQRLHPLCWYARSFDLPENVRGKRLRLHFGAVDYRADVWLNGTHLGRHVGGYDPFDFDVTALAKPSGNRLLVRVDDDMGEAKPRGKQSANPHGCEYMHVTGIWQTVWLEGVASTYIKEFAAFADPDSGILDIHATVDGPDRGLRLTAVLGSQQKDVVRGHAGVVSGAAALSIKAAKPECWSPENPFLYDLELSLSTADGTTTDRVQSYVGFRKITTKDGAIYLNGKPFFLLSALDQGYYPQSLYTPPSDAALRQDVEWAKRYGLNSVRKHQIVAEPRFHYWCDRLGLTVWGEMADWGADLRHPDEFLRQWTARVKRDINHPSIITWIPTNEQTSGEDAVISGVKVRLYRDTKALDPTRLVVDSSGYCHTETDITDLHVNPSGKDCWRGWWSGWRNSVAKTGNFVTENKLTIYAKGFRPQGQPVVISEAGNFLIAAYSPEGPWKAYGLDSPYHAGPIATPQEFLEAYRQYFLDLAADPECAGFSYVQLYDVEGEINGYLTYGRRPKIPAESIARIHAEILRIRAAIEAKAAPVSYAAERLRA